MFKTTKFLQKSDDSLGHKKVRCFLNPMRFYIAWLKVQKWVYKFNAPLMLIESTKSQNFDVTIFEVYWESKNGLKNSYIIWRLLRVQNFDESLKSQNEFTNSIILYYVTFIESLKSQKSRV